MTTVHRPSPRRSRADDRRPGHDGDAQFEQPRVRARRRDATSRPSIPSSAAPEAAGADARSWATAPASDPVRVRAAFRPGATTRHRRRRGGSRRHRDSWARRGGRAPVAHARAHEPPRLRSCPIVSGGRSRSRYARHVPRQPMIRRTRSSQGFSGMPRIVASGSGALPPGRPAIHSARGSGATIASARPSSSTRAADGAAARRVALGADVDPHAADLGRPNGPPRRSDASTTVTRMPIFAQSSAATRPPIPPPTTTTMRARARARRGRRAARVHRPPVHPLAPGRSGLAGVSRLAERRRAVRDWRHDAPHHRRRRRRPTAHRRPARPADRDAAGPAGRDGDRVRGAAQDPGARRIGGCRDARRLRPRGVRRGVQDDAGGPPLPRVDGRARAVAVRGDRAGLGRRCGGDLDAGRPRRAPRC